MLDLLSLYVASGLVILVVTAMFVLEVVNRGITPVDRIWTIALGSAVATAVCYAGAAWLPALWWFVGVGNGASVLTTFAVWSGIRAYDGRRPLLGVGAGVAALGASVTLVQGPASGEWAGGGFMIAATGAGACLAAVQVLCGRLRGGSTGLVLAVVLGIVAAFYGLRLAIYLTHGPYSVAFRTYVGTESTTLVVLLLVVAAAFAMTSLRADHVQRQRERQQSFDPVTGARTPASFRKRGTTWLVAAQGAGRPVAVVSVIVESLAQLATAFGTDAAERALVGVAEVCREEAPQPALIGCGASDADGFDLLLVGHSSIEAVAWAEQLRKQVIDAPVEVPGGTMRLRVSVGVAVDTDAKYDLAGLCAAALQGARAALAGGGNRVEAIAP